jgi:iron(III) transport system permease protein
MMPLSHQIKSIWFWLSAAVLSILVVFLLYPLFNVLISSVGAAGESGWSRLVNDPKYYKAVGNSVVLGLVVTTLSCLIGVPLAYFTARFSFTGKALIAVLPLTTIVVPEVIASQTWLMMLGNNGLITRWVFDTFGYQLPSFYGWFGLITVMTFMYYTYIYIGTLAAIRGFDVQLEEAEHVAPQGACTGGHACCHGQRFAGVHACDRQLRRLDHSGAKGRVAVCRDLPELCF